MVSLSYGITAVDEVHACAGDRNFETRVIFRVLTHVWPVRQALM